MEAIDTKLQSTLLDAILLIAIVLIATGSSRIFKYNEMNKWVQINAVIFSMKESWRNVALSATSTVKYYYPCIDYSYSFNNKQYNANRVAFDIQNIWVCEVDDWGLPLKEGDKFWHTWKEGSNITAYVNPKQPTQSVIFNKFSNKYKSHNIALIAGGLLLGAIWALLNAIIK